MCGSVTVQLKLSCLCDINVMQLHFYGYFVAPVPSNCIYYGFMTPMLGCRNFKIYYVAPLSCICILWLFCGFDVVQLHFHGDWRHRCNVVLCSMNIVCSSMSCICMLYGSCGTLFYRVALLWLNLAPMLCNCILWLCGTLDV